MENKHKVLGIFLILILGFVLIEGVGDINLGYQSVTGTGYTVTSITTSPNIITDNTNIANVDYIIDTIFNGGGQSVTARITPDDIGEETGYKSDYAFTIQATAIDETVSYPILNTGNKVYKYIQENVGSGSCDSDAAYEIEVCRSSVLGYCTSSDKICIYKKTDAIVGEFDNPTVKNSAKITVLSSESSSESYTKTIDTTTSQSVYFNDNTGNRIVSASWVGSLVTGNSYPSPSNYVATYAVLDSAWSHKGNWYVSYDDEYDEYKEAEATANDNFRRWESEYTDVESYEQAINLITEQVSQVNAARQTLVGGSSVTIGTAQTYVDRDDTYDGKVQITLDNSINNMEVVFRVAADWIGINIPSGTPDILDVECPDFASGDSSGYCEITVKNQGTGTGIFVGTMLDCGAFTQKTSSSKISFDSGETSSILVYIDAGDVATETTRSCTFKVYDYNDAANYDTSTATVHMTEAKSCVPGEIRKDNRILYQCNAAGTGEDILLSCTSDETLLRGDDEGDGLDGYYCEEGGDSGFGLSDLIDLLGGSDAGTLKTIFLYIVVLAVLIGGGYLFILSLPTIIMKVLPWFLKKLIGGGK